MAEETQHNCRGPQGRTCIHKLSVTERGCPQPQRLRPRLTRRITPKPLRRSTRSGPRRAEAALAAQAGEDTRAPLEPQAVATPTPAGALAMNWTPSAGS